MKLDAPMPARGEGGKGDNAYRAPARGERPRPAAEPSGQGAMAAAFAKLQGRR